MSISLDGSTNIISGLATGIQGVLPLLQGGIGAQTLIGANIAATNTANSFVAAQTFLGSTSTQAAIFTNSTEITNTVSAAPSSVTNFYLNTGSTQYYTSNAANNWTVNVAFSSGTTLNSAIGIGQTTTLTLMTTQGTTAFYASALTIDGVAVTPKWRGGTAPVSGNISGIDVYTYRITKTAASTYIAIASVYQFK